MKLGYLTLKTLFSRYFGEGRIQDASGFPFKFILCDICPEVVLMWQSRMLSKFVNMGILDFSIAILRLCIPMESINTLEKLSNQSPSHQHL